MADALIILAKFLFYLGSLAGIGAGTHYALRIVTARRWLWAGAGLALVALGVRLLGLNLEIVGDQTRLLDFSMFEWVWPGVRDQVFSLLLGIIILASAGLLRLPFLAFIGALCLAHGFGLAGHARSEGMPGLLWVLVSTHVLIAGFWFIAPATLWPRQGLNRNVTTSRMHVFSRTATYAVPLMIIAGIWLAFIIADGLTGLFGTSYGRLIVLKLLVVIIALAAGAYNKIYLTRNIRSGAPKALTALRRSLSIEFVLFLTALLLIAAATTVFGPQTH